MGNTRSSSNKEDALQNVFAKELSSLGHAVNNIMSNHALRSGLQQEGLCENYTLALEEDLHKHLKVELMNLKQKIILLPVRNTVRLKDKTQLTKNDLCRQISNHYAKILKLLELVQHIYNIENNGDFSIAGICRRNIILQGKLMHVTYCEDSHRDYTKQKTPDSNGDRNTATIDFQQLKGLDIYLNTFLTPSKRNAFLSNMHALLARKEKEHIVHASCTGDEILGIELYKRYGMHDRNVSCPSSVKPDDTQYTSSVFVAANNPIFHKDMCYSKWAVIVQMDTKDGKVVRQLYDNMIKNYKANIEWIERIIDMLVERGPHGYTLRHLTTKEMDSVYAEVTKAIAVLFYRSLHDYYALLDQAKKGQHLVMEHAKQSGGGAGGAKRAKPQTPGRKGIQRRVLQRTRKGKAS